MFVVVEDEGWEVTPALGLPAPKDPLFLRDSPASESEVTTPGASLIRFSASGSFLT